MIKVMLYGCDGHMGHVLRDLIAQTDNMTITAGVDARASSDGDFPVYTSPEDCKEEVDVIIDFSVAPAVDAALDFAASHNIPIVECTTGLSEDQLAHLERCAEKTPVLRSSNMSLGINILIKLLKAAVPVLGNAGFDIDIVEKHHRRKLDAPSGTAIALAEAANEAADGRYAFVYDRSQRREQRPADEIGISAVRGGTIVGQHDVIFAGTDEVIELHHTAYSRAIFGKGAIEAARYLIGRPAGLYDMSDVIEG